MDRRQHIKLLLLGSMAGTTLFLPGCKTEKEKKAAIERILYGRTPEELAYDEDIYAEQFFDKKDLEHIALLCDIILPPKEGEQDAVESGLVDFIDFVVKDMEGNQEPMRNGLDWLYAEAQKRYSKEFIQATNEEQIALIDEIAYPDEAKEEMKEGVAFFSHLRNLVVTGYYTSKAGIEDLGYMGNTPNVWDGVPQDVLDKHGLTYEEEWVAKCTDQEKRTDIARWDDNKNLIT